MRFSLLALLAGIMPLLGQTSVKIDLVLTPEFCAAKIKKGQILSGDRETFTIGKVTCATLPGDLKESFPGIVAAEAPSPSGPGRAALILIPKLTDLGTNHTIWLGSTKELVVYMEWTVEDSNGRALWIQTVSGKRREAVINLAAGLNNESRLIAPAIKDMANNLVRELMAAPGVQAIMHSAP